MKQINSVIAVILISSLLVVMMLGIGVNALTNTASMPTNTAAAGVLVNASNARTGGRSEQRNARNARSTTATTNNGEVQFTQ